MIDNGISDTERAVAQTKLLLERYGLINRALTHVEELRGGYRAIYKVLTSMEDAGQVRRGYFVEGLPGAQFGQTTVINRLRTLSSAMAKRSGTTESEVLILAAMDPANVYGRLLE